MKRIFVCLVTLLVLLSCTYTTFAVEEIKFNGYSDADLLALKTQVDAEVEARGLKANKVNKLPSGKYVVGTDIPAGSYLFQKIEGDEYTAILYLFDSSDAEKHTTRGSADENGCMMNLSEGQILKITWTAVNASKFNIEW